MTTVVTLLMWAVSKNIRETLKYLLDIVKLGAAHHDHLALENILVKIGIRQGGAVSDHQ